MTARGLKLGVYFGEGHRVGAALLSEALLDLLAAQGVLASVLLRGVEGFGVKHRLRTDRLLSLSEDLPLVAVAVDTADRIARLLPEVTAMAGEGLVTLERVALPGVSPAPDEQTAQGDDDDPVKLTIYCGRAELGAGRPVVPMVVDALRRAHVAGATVLAGLDGTILGRRRRARLLSRNRGVPALVMSIGARSRHLEALDRVRGLLPPEHVVTLERVRVMRQEGRVLAELPPPPAGGSGVPAVWRRVTVVAGEDERWEGRPLHAQLVRRLREGDAAGATVLRGVLGYSGSGPLHADRLLAIRRRTPIVLTLVDAVDEVARLWPLIARATASSGLVTCEAVPAARAVGPTGVVGGLRVPRG